MKRIAKIMSLTALLLIMSPLISGCNGNAGRTGNAASDSLSVPVKDETAEAVGSSLDVDRSSRVEDSGSKSSETEKTDINTEVLSESTAQPVREVALKVTPVPSGLKPSTGKSSETAKKKPYYTSVVGMWYTVWWDAEGEPYFSHWKDWTRIKPLEDGYYAADHSSKLEKDFKYFKKIGIDFLILDDTNGHSNDGGNIGRHVDKCFETAKKLGPSNSPKLSVAGGAPLWVSKDPEMMQREMDIFYNYYKNSNDMYFMWKGKPLYISYTSKEYFTWNDKDDRFTIRRAIGSIMEGYDYLPNPLEGLWGWVFNDQMPESEVMGVMPGWDTKHLGRGTTPLPRKNGERYIKMWLNAIKRNPEAISIVSWNDHAEETGIEAVEQVIEIPERKGEDPYLYQKITEGYLALRYGLLDKWYYRAESSNDIYQYAKGKLVRKSSAPGKEVVIVVPDNYFKWAGLKTS